MNTLKSADNHITASPHHLKATFIKYVSLNVFGMIGLSCYILADTFFISQGVGANGLTALNLALPVYSLIHGTGLMLGMGGATRFSVSGSKAVFTQSLYFAAAAALIFLFCGIFLTDEIAVLLGSDAATHAMTVSYLQVILCFAPLFLLNNVIICFVRNDKNPRLSMAAMLIGSLSNIVLDYVFVFPLQMGMFGAALATGIAPAISLVILSLHFFKKRRSSEQKAITNANTISLCKQPPSFKALRDISSLGAAALITELSSGIVIIVFNKIILEIGGNTAVAAYGVIANIALVVISVFTGIAQGVQPLISTCYGKENKADSNVKKLLRYAVTASLGFAVLIYTASYIFARPITAAFNRDSIQALTDIAVSGLRIYFTAFIFVGVNIISAAFFAAVDKPKYAFIISVLRGFIIIIPVAVLLSTLLSLTGVWLSIVVAEGLVCVLSVLLLLRSNRK